MVSIGTVGLKHSALFEETRIVHPSKKRKPKINRVPFFLFVGFFFLPFPPDCDYFDVINLGTKDEEDPEKS